MMFSTLVNWIPPSSLRGNSRGSHWKQSAEDKKVMRRSGYDHGIAWLAKPGNARLIPPLHVEIVYRNPRAIDGDNLLIGYKSFIDGLIEAGVLIDDAPDVVVRWWIEWAGYGAAESAIEVKEVRE